jgi:hypothetical protein
MTLRDGKENKNVFKYEGWKFAYLSGQKRVKITQRTAK